MDCVSDELVSDNRRRCSGATTAGGLLCANGGVRIVKSGDLRESIHTGITPT